MWRGRTQVWAAGATTALLIVAIAADWIATRPRAFDPDSLSDADRGVVIEGICPADVGAVRVDSPYAASRWTINATVYPGLTVLRWEVPDVADLDGYVLARLAYGQDRSVDSDAKRIPAVSDISNDGGGYVAFADSEGFRPGTSFVYRVFPVVAGKLGKPTDEIHLWSPPEKPPLTPTRVSAGRNRKGEIKVDAWSGYHEWMQGIRVARRELGATDWQVVHDPPPPLGRDGSIDEFHSWTDADVDPGKEYEYAVCQTNARGASKAMIAGTAPARLEEVAVDSPRNIRAVQSPYAITVFWEPSADASVVGYRVERVVDGEDEYEHDRLKGTGDRADNFVEYDFSSMPERDSHRFRVRTVTNEGVGKWSAELVVDSSQPGKFNGNHAGPRIESVGALYDLVLLVWSANELADDTLFRILRRSVHGGDAWEFYTYRPGYWVDEAEFDWDDQYGMKWHGLGWADTVGVRPDTEYEYAVQLKRGEVVEPPSEPVSIQTRPLPESIRRLPLTAYDLEASPKGDGVHLNWTLPTDPTLKGLVVRIIGYNHDIQSERIVRPALAPTSTRYFVEDSHGFGVWPACIFVQTFNDYGMQSLFRQTTCSLGGAELAECEPTREWIYECGNGGIPRISFDSCFPMFTSIVRHELTLDGFKTKSLVQPCLPSWSDFGFECEYEDEDVKPHTWYVYELRQVTLSGEVSQSVRDLVTGPGRTR